MAIRSTIATAVKSGGGNKDASKTSAGYTLPMPSTYDLQRWAANRSKGSSDSSSKETNTVTAVNKDDTSKAKETNVVKGTGSLLGKDVARTVSDVWSKLKLGLSGNGKTTTSEDPETMTAEDIINSIYGATTSEGSTSYFDKNNRQYLDQSQRLSDQIYNYTDFLKNLGVNVMTEAQSNPLETDWGKALLDYYGVASLDAANGALADGAADNNGNIDSYAAANAERQRLSKLNAGITALSGMSSDRVSNMLSVLDSIGVNTANLFNIEDSNLTTAADNAATAAGLDSSIYSTDAQSTADYYNAMLSLYGGSSTDETDETEETTLDKETAKDLMKVLWDSSRNKTTVLDDMVAINPAYANYLPGLEYWLDQIIQLEQNGGTTYEDLGTAIALGV